MNDQPAAPPPPPSTSGAAVAGLVLSLLSLLCILPVIGSILGILFGFIGRGAVAQGQGRVSGKGLATAGIFLGFLGLLIQIAATAGMVYIGYVTVDAILETSRQMEQVQRAAQKKDLEGIADALTGPDSMPKEDILRKFREGQERYGTFRTFDLAEGEFDPSRGSEAFKIPLRLVFNVESDGPPSHLIVRLLRIHGKFQVTDLEFKEGHVADKVREGRD